MKDNKAKLFTSPGSDAPKLLLYIHTHEIAFVHSKRELSRIRNSE